MFQIFLWFTLLVLHISNQTDDFQDSTCISSSDEQKNCVFPAAAVELTNTPLPSQVEIVHTCDDAHIWEVSGSKLSFLNATLIHNGVQNGKNTAYTKAIKDLVGNIIKIQNDTKNKNCITLTPNISNETVNKMYNISQIGWKIKINQIMDRFGDEIGIINQISTTESYFFDNPNDDTLQYYIINTKSGNKRDDKTGNKWLEYGTDDSSTSNTNDASELQDEIVNVNVKKYNHRRVYPQQNGHNRIGGKIRKYKKTKNTFATNDTITVIFDIENGILKFVKNEISLGIAFDYISNTKQVSVDDALKYRLAIITGIKNNSYSLVETKILLKHRNYYRTEIEIPVDSKDIANDVANFVIADLDSNIGHILTNLTTISEMLQETTKNVNKHYNDICNMNMNVDQNHLNVTTNKEIKSILSKIESCEILGNKIEQQLSDYKEKIKLLRDKVDKLQMIDYKNWSLNEIINWINSLENGMFKKYDAILRQSFKQDSVTGADLPQITRNDLKMFGVNVFGDRVLLESHFQKLVDT